MADAPDPQWLDLLEEDIPVVDATGKQRHVKGLDFVDDEASAAPPTAKSGAAPAAATSASTPSSAPAAPVPEPAAAASPAAPATPTADILKPVSKEDLLENAYVKDVQDAARGQADVTKKTTGEEKTKAVASLLDGMVDEAVSIVGVSFPDEDIKKRFRTLVSLYFRDLRDQLETTSKFTMPVASGGMGMNDAEAERVMGMLKMKNDEFHSLMDGRAADGKARYVRERAEKVLTETEKDVQKDQAQIDEIYQNLLKKGGAAPPTTAAPAAPREPAALPKIVPIRTPGKPLPAEPSASQPAAPAPVPSVPPPAAAPAPQPAAPVTPPAAPAMPSGQLPARPTVSDVKFVHKLTGPVEELRALQVKDFRRLSKDPREATLKIKDKIDLLEDTQSFEVKTQGIKAWQDSEVNKLYLDILRKSLEGKPVNDVIAEREAKGEPTLNKAEFDAVMELNRKLRFG